MITHRNSWSTVGSWFTPSLRSPTASSSGPTAFMFAIDLKAAVTSFFVGSTPTACVTGHRGRPSMILSLGFVGFCVNMAPRNHVWLLSHFVYIVQKQQQQRHWQRKNITKPPMCVCLLPINSGHQVRWTYQSGSHIAGGRSHRIRTIF